MKETFTKKLFFKAYDHRVSVLCRSTNYRLARKEFDHRPTVAEVFELAKASMGEKKFRSRASSHHLRKQAKSGHEIWQYNGELVTLYFKDPAFLETLKATYSDHLLEVERPVNQQHSDTLSKDRMITRKQLFHRKYRYCIRTVARSQARGWSKEHIIQMKQWHRETFAHLTPGVDFYIYDGWAVNFFFANAQDAMMMKMVWSEDIEGTDRIMLLSEIEANKQVAEEAPST